MPEKQIKNDEYYYSEINPSVEKTFSYEQKKEIKRILKRAARIPSKKIVDFKTTFWFFKPFYIAFFLGIDKRTGNRRTDSEKMHIAGIGFKTLIYLSEAFLCLLVLLAMLYVLKTAVGIDLMPNSHLKDILPEEYIEKFKDNIPKEQLKKLIKKGNINE